MQFPRLIQAAIIAAIASLSSAALSEILIFAPDNDYAREVAEKLKSRIDTPSHIVHSLDVNSSTRLVVALGHESFLVASAETEVAVLGSFLSPADQPTSKRSAPTYRIFSDPSPDKIAEFLKKRLPNSTIGYIYTGDEAPVVQQLAKALENSSTRFEPIRFSGNTFSDLRGLSRKGINSMLVSTNHEVYHPERVRFVLEALFRKKMPVISMTASLIPAGATVSIAPTAEAVINATALSVNGLVKGAFSEPPNDTYVEDVTIEVNPAMASYFNIDFGPNTR